MSSLVNVEKQGSIAILELNRKPVNSFSMEFLHEINSSLDELENDQDCQGLIITSVCHQLNTALVMLLRPKSAESIKVMGNE